MDHLKEQLQKHYNKTELPEGLRQKLLTLEVPEPTPVPVRVNRKRLLTPIAAMFIAAISILGGGKYLMDAMPLTAIPPESAPTEVVPIESAADFEDVAPTDVETAPAQDTMPTAPQNPEPSSTDEPTPGKNAPEQNCPGVATPQSPTPTAPSNPAPPSGEVTDPAPPPESLPPIEDGGNEDDPPSEPGAADPVDPPVDDPVDPPVDPVDPPDDPVVPPIEIPDIPFPPGYKPGDGETPARPAGKPEPPDDPIDPPDDPVDPPDDPVDPPDDPPIIPGPPPEITGRYEKTNGQHLVHLTNCDTGEICTLDLTSEVTTNGYHNIHNIFDCLILINLKDANPPRYPSTSTAPSAPPKPDISEIEFELKMEVICVIPR